MDDWGERGGLNVKCNPSTPPSLSLALLFALIRYDVRSTGGCCIWLSTETRSRRHRTSMCSLFRGIYDPFHLYLHERLPLFFLSHSPSLCIHMYLQYPTKGTRKNKERMAMGSTADRQILPLTSTKISLITVNYRTYID